MKLTRSERTRLLAGDTPRIIRPTQPNLEPGDRIPVEHSKPRRYSDPDDGFVFDAPAETSVWLTVTQVVRHRKGGYMVRYELTDTRHPAWLLAKGSGYTTILDQAMDDLEVNLTDRDRKRLAVVARAERAAGQADSEDALRQQERAFRNQLRETMRGLGLPARTALLAVLERDLRCAASEVDRAA